ncbi:hypothetical protein D3C81_714900 [compost metagenome]
MIGILFVNRCNLNIPRTYCRAEMINLLDRLQWRSLYARRMLAAHFIELTGNVSSINRFLPLLSNMLKYLSTTIGAIGDIERFSISGTSVFKSRQTYEGVRDTRRVLFLMTLLLISPKISENSFRVKYNKRAKWE